MLLIGICFKKKKKKKAQIYAADLLRKIKDIKGETKV